MEYQRLTSRSKWMEAATDICGIHPGRSCFGPVIGVFSVVVVAGVTLAWDKILIQVTPSQETLKLLEISRTKSCHQSRDEYIHWMRLPLVCNV